MLYHCRTDFLGGSLEARCNVHRFRAAVEGGDRIEENLAMAAVLCRE
ncbi:MAG: hypothetical protein ACI9K5_003149, partial [Gammaproteobacteria bacterium]